MRLLLIEDDLTLSRRLKAEYALVALLNWAASWRRLNYGNIDLVVPTAYAATAQYTHRLWQLLQPATPTGQ